MKTSILLYRKTITLLIAAFGFVIARGQQDIIINKDNTRPETKEQMNRTGFSSLQSSPFTISKHNGYNDIQWTTPVTDASNRYIVEYSFDGINFSSGGQLVSSHGIYSYKHYTLDTRPVMYRLRTEDALGKRYYSNSFLLDGEKILPVQLYSTVVTGNMINATAQFPVEKVIITSADGAPVFSKDVNGVRDFIPIAIPSLSRGIYFITFYGNGWNSTTKFVAG